MTDRLLLGRPMEKPLAYGKIAAGAWIDLARLSGEGPRRKSPQAGHMSPSRFIAILLSLCWISLIVRRNRPTAPLSQKRCKPAPPVII
jgi:hypothetical protein